jgi:DNA-binding IclR family transcriptional regulator
MKPATSIEKVCRVLDALRRRSAMGVTEVAQHTGLLPSDAHRILSSLAHFAYVEQDHSSKRYRLGMELLKLGHLVHARMEIRQTARPFLERLAEDTSSTANMAVFDRRELAVVFVEQIDSESEIQLRLRVGSIVGAHSTSVGKVLLAHLPEATLEQVVKKHGLKKKTRYTITERSRLAAELEMVRSDGYAIDREEGVEGAFCVGAPVYDHSGQVVAAVSVSTMLARVSSAGERTIITAVKRTSKGISNALGYPPYSPQPSER